MDKYLERLLTKIKINEETDCWEWQSTLDKEGYGKFGVNYKMVATHRYSYEMFKGEIGKGMVIDHLCHNRKCCNPLHLEMVTVSVNNYRRLPRTHCKRGHEFTEETTWSAKNGKKQCKICNKLRQKGEI